MNVKKVREDFPLTEDAVYLNVANHCPLSRPVQDAVKGINALLSVQTQRRALTYP